MAAKRGIAAERRASLGAVPVLAILAAGGLIMVALGNNAAREATSNAQPLFWAGLVLIYAPISLRLASARASRAERVSLVVLLGAALYLVKVLFNPSDFVLHDELATWRQTYDVLNTGHFLSANPLVQGYAGYPTLAALTAALSQLTGLSIFNAGIVVIGIARVTLMLALFLLLERVTRSTRAAGIGVVVYVCNPNFLYFDSQFGYESLALPIAAVLLLAALRWSELDSARRPSATPGLVAAMAVLAATLAITHHVTSYGVLAFLLAWVALRAPWERRAWPAPVEAAQAPADDRGSGAATTRRSLLDGPALPALLLAASISVWFILVASGVTNSELGGVFRGDLHSVTDLLLHGSGTKTLFHAGNDQNNSTGARALAATSVVFLLVLIALGLRTTRRRWRESTGLFRALVLVAVLYPATLVLRLTAAGTETSQRASEFVFVGLGLLAGVLMTSVPRHSGRHRRTAKALIFAAVATEVFVGCFIVAESPVTRQPGPFLVSDDARSISPQGIAAARFAGSYLPAGSRILVDRPNSTLMASYGHLDPVTGSVDDISVTRVFFSRKFDAVDQRVIGDDAIDYILVDLRLSQAPPVNGYYFEPDEPGDTITDSELTKFDSVPGLSRVFDNGAIVIYDTSGIRST